jgi:hypothetical protein
LHDCDSVKQHNVEAAPASPNPPRDRNSESAFVFYISLSSTVNTSYLVSPLRSGWWIPSLPLRTVCTYSTIRTVSWVVFISTSKGLSSSLDALINFVDNLCNFKTSHLAATPMPRIWTQVLVCVATALLLETNNH